jgi:hypothetical protein
MDYERIQSAFHMTLPRIVHWEINEFSVDYDFSLAQDGLRRIDADDIVGGSFDEEWHNLIVFGVASHADCGGATYFICVCGQTGIVYGFDPDRTEPKFLLNSSVPQFLQTFAFLDRYFQAGLQLPGHVDDLLREMDQQAYNDSEWRLMIDYLSED